MLSQHAASRSRDGTVRTVRRFPDRAFKTTWNVGLISMPIYEYVCAACGHRLDAWQKMSDPVLSDCPACQGSSLQKLISAPGISVKDGRAALEPACAAGACPACSID